MRRIAIDELAVAIFEIDLLPRVADTTPDLRQRNRDSRIAALRRVGFAVNFHSRLAEERVEFPKLVLPTLVERVIMALRALHGGAEKDLGSLGGRLHAIFGQLLDQKVDRAVVSPRPREWHCPSR